MHNKYEKTPTKKTYYSQHIDIYHFSLTILYMREPELQLKIEECFKINPPQKKALTRLGITTIKDLLFHFPNRYSDIAKIKSIKDVLSGDEVTIYGKVTKLKSSKTFHGGVPIAEATITDNTGSIKARWFHQPYIIKMIQEDTLMQLSGKITGKKVLYLANPEVAKTKNLPIDVGDSLFAGKKEESFGTPIYSESRGISTKWFYHHIKTLLSKKTHERLLDPIPSAILKKYYLPSLHTALIWIHSPKNNNDATAARKRFAFEEIFYIQLSRIPARTKYKKHKAFRITNSKKLTKDFFERQPFEPTEAQLSSIEAILKDLNSDAPMTRLLEGDVGSGKTAVAAATSYAVISSHPKGRPKENLQIAYMAPTEILAKQLYESFVGFFSHLPISMGLITGSGCKKFPSKVEPTESTSISKPQLKKWVEQGEISILIGTHSLIQKSVKFKNLAYSIIDEQHRFGTNQRAGMVKKDEVTPHLLSMTATPIPRTLALTIYGDLDLTILDQMPKGRKKIITEIVLPGARKNVYSKVTKELKEGRQLYVICPRINEPDPEKEHALNVKSVTEEAERLKNDTFKNYTIDILHSKMTPKEKETTMNNFLEKKIDILVATSVVEVGVNVPNATVIIIEGAERFGLSQLHQLRGRVIRSNHQAYCYVFSDTKTQKTLDRLTALKTAKNGFELSELDLTLRGAGELTGKKQWGISDIGMEAIKNIKMVEAARKEAKLILEKDEKLETFPLLSQKLKSRETSLHFE